MMSVWKWMFALAVLCMSTCFSFADAPATQPATEPPTTQAVPLADDSPIRKWYTDLSSEDSTARDLAQTKLMGMTRAEMEGLRILLQQSAPPTPMQAIALHDIVMQAFLATESYPAIVSNDENPTPGFMGLRWSPETQFEVGIAAPVEERIPGFPAFQVLRDGDLIVGVYINPDEPLDQLPNQRTPSSQMIIEVVGKKAIGLQEITLEILRQGQHIRVPIRLAPRPIWMVANDENTQKFLADRLAKFEDYWHKEFEPLIKGKSA